MLRRDLLELRDIRARLDELELLLGDLEPLWDMLDEIMVEHEAAWFASEGEGSWPQLSPVTVADKAARGFPPDILIRTERLIDSLLDPEGAREVSQGRTSLGTFSSKTFNWGTDVPYAEYHQEGTPNMPARPVIVVTPELESRIAEAMESYLEMRLKEADL